MYVYGYKHLKNEHKEVCGSKKQYSTTIVVIVNSRLQFFSHVVLHDVRPGQSYGARILKAFTVTTLPQLWTEKIWEKTENQMTDDDLFKQNTLLYPTVRVPYANGRCPPHPSPTKNQTLMVRGTEGLPGA